VASALSIKSPPIGSSFYKRHYTIFLHFTTHNRKFFESFLWGPQRINEKSSGGDNGGSGDNGGGSGNPGNTKNFYPVSCAASAARELQQAAHEPHFPIIFTRTRCGYPAKGKPPGEPGG